MMNRSNRNQSNEHRILKENNERKATQCAVFFKAGNETIGDENMSKKEPEIEFVSVYDGEASLKEVLTSLIVDRILQKMRDNSKNAQEPSSKMAS